MTTQPFRPLMRHAPALVFFGVAAVCAVGWWTSHIETQQLERQLAAEKSRGERAERLIGFVMFDLREDLTPIGRIDVLEDLSDNLRTYYEDAAATGSPQARHRLAVACRFAGDAARARGNTAEAQRHYDRAIDIGVTLVESDTEGDRSLELAKSLARVGDMRADAGERDIAGSLHRRALTYLEIQPQQPEIARDVREERGKIAVRLGNLARDNGQHRVAREHFGTALAVFESLERDDDQQLRYRRNVAATLEKLGNLELERGRLSAALDHYQRAFAIASELLGQDPGNSTWLRDKAVTLDRLGDVKLARGEADSALSFYVQSLAVVDELAAREPEAVEFTRDLSVSHEKLGDVFATMNRTTDARASYRLGISYMKNLVSRSDHPRWQRDLAVLHYKLAEIAEEPKARRLQFRRCAELLGKVREPTPQEREMLAVARASTSRPDRARVGRSKRQRKPGRDKRRFDFGNDPFGKGNIMF